MIKNEEKLDRLKKLLYSYTYIEDEIEGVNEKICNLGEVINSQRDIKAPNLTGLPRGNEISDVVYESVEKIIMTYGQEIARLENQLDRLFKKRNLISDLLETLSPIEKQIIELRYFKKYKIWMIRGCVNYEKSQIYEYLNEAMKKMLEVFEIDLNIKGA